MKKKYVYITASVLVLLIIDQLTKFLVTGTNESICIIDGILQFTYTKNTGVAFSLIQNNLLGIVITNVIILGIVIHFMVVQFDNMDKGTKLCGSLILAGGMSNLLDRLIKGYVVDFIDVTPILNFPIFNIADIYIVVGWIVFVILTIKYTIENKRTNINKK